MIKWRGWWFGCIHKGKVIYRSVIFAEGPERAFSEIDDRWEDDLQVEEIYFNEGFVARSLLRYFSSGRDLVFKKSFDGTDFQERVWRMVSTIPFGETFTYKEVAVSLDNPDAFRAVGNALNQNPVPLFVPCHRVVSVNGLGGFGRGKRFKRFLLSFESYHG